MEHTFPPIRLLTHERRSCIKLPLLTHSFVPLTPQLRSPVLAFVLQRINGEVVAVKQQGVTEQQHLRTFPLGHSAFEITHLRKTRCFGRLPWNLVECYRSIVRLP